MAEIGIIVSLKDGASKGLQGFRGAVDKMKNAFGALGGAMAKINQSLEIGRKLWGVVRLAVIDNIKTALEFRRAGDPVRKWFEDMGRETKLLRAAIGDALIPVVQGLAEGLGLVGDGAQRWVQENRKLIATGVLDFVIDVGHALTTVVAKGAWVVIKAWAGWQEIIGVVQGLLGKFFAWMTPMLADIMEGVGGIARVFGNDGLANDIAVAAKTLRDFEDDYDAWGEAGINAAMGAAAAADENIAKLNEIEEFVRSKLGDAYAKAARRIIESQTGVTKTLEEQKKLLDEHRKGVADYLKGEDEKISKIRERWEKAAEMAIKQDELEQSLLNAQVERASALGPVFESIGSAFGEMMAGADPADAMKQMVSGVIDGVLAALQAFAAEAFAANMAWFASLGPFGVPLGVAAGAAVQGLIMGLGSGLKGLIGGMAEGGIVTGGIPGRDSVLKLLMPGEEVLSVGNPRNVRNSGRDSMGSMGGITVINNNLLPDRQVTDRATYHLKPSFRRLARLNKAPA